MQIKLTLPDEVVAEMDRMRGDVTRTYFVRRLIESVSGEPTILQHTKTPPAQSERSPEPPIELEKLVRLSHELRISDQARSFGPDPVKERNKMAELASDAYESTRKRLSKPPLQRPIVQKRGK